MEGAASPPLPQASVGKRLTGHLIRVPSPLSLTMVLCLRNLRYLPFTVRCPSWERRAILSPRSSTDHVDGDHGGRDRTVWYALEPSIACMYMHGCTWYAHTTASGGR